MKKITAIFLSLLIVCAILFSVKCKKEIGVPKLTTITFYNVTTTISGYVYTDLSPVIIK